MVLATLVMGILPSRVTSLFGSSNGRRTTMP